MRPEKQLLLDDLKERLEGAPTFLVASYQKMASSSTHQFRTQVRKTGGDFEVVRKRVLVKAAQAADREIDLKTLTGHIGIVFAGDDAVATTKSVFDYGKETEAVAVLGGYFDGQLYTSADMEKISKLPSMDAMRAQFLGLLEAPMSQTLSVMEALLTSVMHCMDNKAKASAE